MPRRGGIRRREVTPDVKYNSELVARIVNNMMLRGKKSVALQIMYDAMDIIGKKTNEDPLKVVQTAIDNLKPLVEVRSRRVGGATYQVPTEVRPTRKLSLAIKWMVNYARARGERSMRERLAGELLDAYNKRGSAYKKREDVHRMAEANRAFAHYRW
jgi:small subunit ribosomal protein S7